MALSQLINNLMSPEWHDLIGCNLTIADFEKLQITQMWTPNSELLKERWSGLQIASNRIDALRSAFY